MNDACLKSLFCGVAVTVMAAAAVKAEEAPANTARQLEEVVVTATRVETNLQKTPIAATAFSEQALKERNITSLLDVSEYVPDLSIGSRSGTSTANGVVAIRGMGVDASASSAAVGIYVDEVYLPANVGNLLGLFDVNRIEVLRGPQGTLFGRNTIAGAIQYITNPPDHHFGGYLDFTGGNQSRTDIQGALNLPLGDTLAVRISGAATNHGGYVHDLLTNTERGADRTRDARLRVRWIPTDRLTIDLKGEYVRERTNGRAVEVSAVNPLSEFVGLAQLFGETRPLTSAYISPAPYTNVGFNAPDYFRFDYSEGQVVLSYRLTDDINLKSISAYSFTRSVLAQDFDNTPLSILAGNLREHLGLFTQEVQVSRQSSSDRLRWTAGGYFYDSRDRQLQDIALGLGPFGSPYGYQATDITSWALYGQASYDLTSRLSATAGVRYSSERNSSFLVGSTPPVRKTFTNTSPYAGLNYNLTSDVMFYVKASEGFRAGGVVPNGALPGNGLAFAPETAWTYEAGARLQFLDRRLRVNPTVFFTDWKNIQFNTLIPTPTTVVAATQNAGNAHIKGFELESQFAATDRLTLTGSFSYLDGHYTHVGNLTRTEFPFGFLASLPNPVTGQVLPGSVVVLPNITLDTPLQRAPSFKYTVGARYSYPLRAGSKLEIGLDYAWTDKQSSAVTIADSVELPSYGLLNARLQYDAPGGHWSLAAYATNLTDKYYLVGGVDFAKGYTAGTRELDIGRPREVGVELSARF